MKRTQQLEGYAMLPIKTILHPTDFSESSSLAFDLACSLAHDYQARLVVLHVAEIPVFGSEVEMLALWAAANPLLRKKLEQLRPPDPSVAVEYRLIEGDAVTEILWIARQTTSDVIVMGTHGRTGLRHLIMGSVAEQVVRKAPCPVVTVKAPASAPVPRQESAYEMADLS
jgi:nucleotide-binding universal stress UspA family protein